MNQKKTIEIPHETVEIMQEYFKFNEYFKKVTGRGILLRDFMDFLDKKHVLVTTKDWLYKIKDWVKLVYEPLDE